MRPESTTRWWRWALLFGVLLLLVVTNDTKSGVLGSGSSISSSSSSSQNEGGGWAYLPGHDEADHDARDAAVLARFHDRRRRHLVAATTAAELFQSVVAESAQASFGPQRDDVQPDGTDPVQPFLDSPFLFSSGGNNGASRIDNGTGGTGKGGRWETKAHKGGKAGSGKAERGQGSPTNDNDDNDNDDNNDAANDSTPSPSANAPPSSTAIAADPAIPSRPVARPAIGKGKGHGNNKSKSQGDDDDSAADSTSMPLATAPPSAAIAADPMRPPSVPVARPTGGKGHGNNKSNIQDDDNARPVGKGKGTSYKSKFQDDDDDVDDNTTDDDDDALDLKEPTLSPSSAKRPHTVSKSEKSVKPSDDDAAGNADSACHDFEFATDDRRFRHGRHDRQRALQFDGAGCSPNVLRVAAQMDDFSSFVALVVAAGMVDVFDCGGPFTLLVPTNVALSGLDQKDWTDIELREFVLSHVLPGVTRRDDFGTGTVEALSGGNVDVSVTGSNAILFNDGVNLMTADIMACNGVLHGIDAVLMDLVVADDPIPTMAPVESSTMAPVESSTMAPVESPTMAPVKSPTMAPVKTPTIAPTTPCVGLADAIRQDPSMSIAVQVIERSGLEKELTSGGEKFTVLIPTDEAIRALGSETLTRLQDPSNFNTTLSMVLYHVIPGIVEADDFQMGPIPTLLDDEAIVVALNPLLLDNTRVTSTDNAFCGGIYHVLDAVLIP